MLAPQDFLLLPETVLPLAGPGLVTLAAGRPSPPFLKSETGSKDKEHEANRWDRALLQWSGLKGVRSWTDEQKDMHRQLDRDRQTSGQAPSTGCVL